MKGNERKTSAKRFSDSLRELILQSYCVGGCSEDELRMAYADFLMSTAHMFLNEITTADVECPPLR